MSRRRRAEKRKVHPDAKYGDRVLSKFINCLMLDGKKSVAEKIVYGALDKLPLGEEAQKLTYFHEVLDAVKPEVEVHPRRVGGATYQVPVDVREERREALAIRWLIAAANSRSDRTMCDKLAGEFQDAHNNRGAAIKKRDDTHKMADANKAFAHFRW